MIENQELPHFVFLSIRGNRFSRTLNLYHGLLKKGYEADWFEIDSRQKCREIRSIVRKFKDQNINFIIASPSHILTPIVLLFLRGKARIFLDAGWPLYDGIISSRRQYGLLGFNFVLTWVIDFVSLHAAYKVFLESESQINFCRKLYFVSRKRLFLLATGFDESRINSLSSNLDFRIAPNERMVFFRGGPQEEAGLEILFQAITLLEKREDIKFFVVSKKSNNHKLTNMIFFDEFVEDETLWAMLRRANLVLGQLSNHRRLLRTIPHKFFEAAVFGRAFLSADKGELGRLVMSGVVAGFNPGDAQSLANKIEALLKQPNLIHYYENAISSLYLEEFSQEKMVSRFLSAVL
jgi:glycosyltransferase involved in cell wall biosynthesis